MQRLAMLRLVTFGFANRTFVDGFGLLCSCAVRKRAIASKWSTRAFDFAGHWRSTRCACPMLSSGSSVQEAGFILGYPVLPLVPRSC